MYLTDEDEASGSPASYTLLGQFRLFRAGGGARVAVQRCYSAMFGTHSTSPDCGGPPWVAERLLGYASTVDGGNGWVALAEMYGRDFGPIAFIRSDDPRCCPSNCTAMNNFVLK